MILDGQIGIDDARWSSPEIRKNLEALSRRAEGKPRDDDVGSAVSDLRVVSMWKRVSSTFPI
jgi:hypothetical protein